MSHRSFRIRTILFLLCSVFSTIAVAQVRGEAPASADEAPSGAAAAPPVERDEASPVEVEPAPAPENPAGTVPIGATPDGVSSGTDPSSNDAGATSARVVLDGANSPASSSGVDVGTGGWKLEYHGFFRAPFRLGIGHRDAGQRAGVPSRDPSDPGVTGAVIPPPSSRTIADDGSVVGRDYDPSDAYNETTYHVPLLPDDQSLTWQHTVHNQADWAEMFFSVGNELAKGTLSIEGYNFTQSSFTDSDMQFGIAQGYVTIQPRMPSDLLKLSVKVGSHLNKYGMAGRYDAGEYDTYLFGRTKVLGITARQTLQLGRARLAFEEGFGGHRAHPSKANTGKHTLLAHGHTFLRYRGLEAGLHLLHAWAQEEDRDGQGCPGPGGVNDDSGIPSSNSTCTTVWGPPYGGGATDAYPVGGVAGFGKFSDGFEGNVWLPDGSLTILGPELKLDAGPFGLFYAGYAMIRAKNSLTVDRAVEVQHSEGGGFFSLGVTNNFLDNPQCSPAKGECSSGGTGNVHTLLLQYELSLTNLLRGLKDGSRFWGEGPDLVTKLYGMYSKVDSEYDHRLDGTFAARERYALIGHADAWGNYPDPYPDYWVRLGDNYSDHGKLKFGADLFGSLFPAMGLGFRVDHVRPNDNLPGQSFTVMSPRVELRSRWVTREKIWIQYSRYTYAQRACSTAAEWNPYLPVRGDATYDFTGSPQNFSGLPLGQDCAQIPSGPRLPDGWGATSMEGAANWRGAPITGANGNPNNPLPDENVVQIGASMWW